MRLPGHIKALLDPGSYPERPDSVTMTQTHISYLFFTPEHVYKVKKPVDFAFLDFTTLEKRLFYCGEEVRLNRRLAKGVYLGVVPVVKKDGSISMGGEGKVLDYAVKMKRLKRETILEEMIRNDTVTPGAIERVALRIGTFHGEAETNPHISSFGLPEAIRKNTEENFSQTRPFRGKLITYRLFDSIRKYTGRFMRDNDALFKKRVRGGFIRDCHGDLHSEQISISNGIDIIDCIEFNERFRFSDVVSDTAFLSMDLDWRGRTDLSGVLDKAYFRKTGDREGRRLLNFYKCYRAYVRGKVEGFKSMEPEVPEEDRRLSYIKARRYFHLAGCYAGGEPVQKLIIVRGLSGTGKSTIARALSDALGAVLFSSDAVRRELAKIPPREHRFEEFEKGIYSKGFTERTYSALIDRGIKAVRAGRSSVLDATFSKRRYIEEARRRAGLGEKGFRVIECKAPDHVIRKRFEKRLKEEEVLPSAVSDMRWDIFKAQKRSYERLTGRRLTIDARRPLHENLRAVIDKIYS